LNCCFVHSKIILELVRVFSVQFFKKCIVCASLFPSQQPGSIKNLSNKTWTKCLLSLSKFFDHLCQRIGGKNWREILLTRKNGSNSHKICKHCCHLLFSFKRQLVIAYSIYIRKVVIIDHSCIIKHCLKLVLRIRSKKRVAWIARETSTFINTWSRPLFTLFKELHTEDPNEFRNYFRMDKTTFKMLLEKVRPLIERQNTKLREAISAAERLAVTLRFLATDFPFPPFYYHIL
jgi:hypothetical protein